MELEPCILVDIMASLDTIDEDTGLYSRLQYEQDINSWLLRVASFFQVNAKCMMVIW